MSVDEKGQEKRKQEDRGNIVFCPTCGKTLSPGGPEYIKESVCAIAPDYGTWFHCQCGTVSRWNYNLLPPVLLDKYENRGSFF